MSEAAISSGVGTTGPNFLLWSDPVMRTSSGSSWEKRHQAHLKRKAVRERAVAHKGGKCEICSYVGIASAYDFHHPDPREKDFNISSRVAWTPALLAELDRTVLLCCRCHREVHAGLHPGYLALEDHDRGADGFMDDELSPDEAWED